MNLNEYQNGALETAVYPEDKKVVYPALGLAGEAGETVDKVKKFLRGDYELDEEHKRAIALEIGYSLEEIGQMNLDKLRSRQQRNKITGDGDYR